MKVADKETTVNIFKNIQKRLAGMVQLAIIKDDISYLKQEVEELKDKVSEWELDLNFTKEEFKELGFGGWDEAGKLWLFPQYIVDFLPLETIVYYINFEEEDEFEETTLGEAIKDRETRLGYLAYGLLLN